MNPDQEHADALDQGGTAPSPGPKTPAPTPSLGDYPELEPVISLALDAVVSSFYPENIDDHFRAYLERVTTAATLAIYAPIAALTAQVGRGANDSRTVRTAEVARAAEDMATSVAKVAEALQTREEATAVTVARDASLAAELVAASDAFSDDQPAMAVTAAAVATAVHDAATAAVLERARAASLVAQSASAAASEVATAADQATIAVELEVFQAAAALREASPWRPAIKSPSTTPPPPPKQSWPTGCPTRTGVCLVPCGHAATMTLVRLCAQLGWGRPPRFLNLGRRARRTVGAGWASR